MKARGFLHLPKRLDKSELESAPQFYAVGKGRKLDRRSTWYRQYSEGNRSRKFPQACRKRASTGPRPLRGCSSMVEQQLPKLTTISIFINVDASTLRSRWNHNPRVGGSSPSSATIFPIWLVNSHPAKPVVMRMMSGPGYESTSRRP